MYNLTIVQWWFKQHPYYQYNQVCSMATI